MRRDCPAMSHCSMSPHIAILLQWSSHVNNQLGKSFLPSSMPTSTLFIVILQSPENITHVEWCRDNDYWQWQRPWKGPPTSVDGMDRGRGSPRQPGTGVVVPHTLNGAGQHSSQHAKHPGCRHGGHSPLDWNSFEGIEVQVYYPDQLYDYELEWFDGNPGSLYLIDSDCCGVLHG